MKSKTEFQKRIAIEGRRDQYVVHREHIRRILTAKGFLKTESEPIAWRAASFSFQPLDGSPHEIEMTPDIETLLNSLDTTSDLDEPFIDGSYGITEQQPAGESVERVACAVPVSAEITGDDTLTPPPLPTMTARNGKTWAKYERGLTENADTLKQRRGSWAELRQQVDPKKRGKPHDIITWVFEHMDDPPHEIDPEEVPSRGALSLLKDCQENAATKSEFRKTAYIKIIPDKKQLEHEAKQTDDGRPQLRLLDAFDEEWAGKEAVNVA